MIKRNNINIKIKFDRTKFRLVLTWICLSNHHDQQLEIPYTDRGVTSDTGNKMQNVFHSFDKDIYKHLALLSLVRLWGNNHVDITTFLETTFERPSIKKQVTERAKFTLLQCL